MPGLAKFDDTQHPRGEHGQFASAGMGHNGGPPIQRRTLHKMPSHYRLAGRVRHGGALPDDAERPVGSFIRAELPFHKPKSVSTAEHHDLVKNVVGTVVRLRDAVVARGLEPTRSGSLIPEGTSKRTIHRAYNHASMIAIHKYGLGHYDFAMDDHVKAELTPLEPFMRYAQRRVLNTMLQDHKGGWKPYREEFGQAFKDGRKDAEGNVRLRVKPLQQMIKAAEFGALCKAVFDETKHTRDKGRFASKSQAVTPAEPEQKPRGLVQPAQLAGGYLGAAALGAAAAKPIAAAGKRFASYAGRRMLSSRLKAGGATALHMGLNFAASYAGDQLGDLTGRKLSGAKGENDKYRTLTGTGMAVSAAGSFAGSHFAPRIANALKQPKAHGLFGIGLSMLGGAAGEVAGNWMQSKVLGHPEQAPPAGKPGGRVDVDVPQLPRSRGIVVHK